MKYFPGGVLFFIVAIIVSVCTVKICNRRKRRKQEQGKQTKMQNTKKTKKFAKKEGVIPNLNCQKWDSSRAFSDNLKPEIVESNA